LGSCQIKVPEGSARWVLRASFERLKGSAQNMSRQRPLFDHYSSIPRINNVFNNSARRDVQRSTIFVLHRIPLPRRETYHVIPTTSASQATDEVPRRDHSSLHPGRLWTRTEISWIEGSIFWTIECSIIITDMTDGLDTVSWTMGSYFDEGNAACFHVLIA
jgi:hypothetical protein